MKNDALKDQPRDVVKLYEAIDTLKKTFTKFVSEIECLVMLLRYKRSHVDKSGYGYKGKKFVYDESITICYFCGKVGDKSSKCKDLPKRDTFDAYNTNKRNTQKDLGT